MNGQHPGHGTNKRYQWEWRHGKLICDRCRQAHKIYTDQYRADVKKRAENLAANRIKLEQSFKGNTVKIPVQLLRDMYFALDPASAIVVDSKVGKYRIDKLIERADLLDKESDDRN